MRTIDGGWCGVAGLLGCSVGGNVADSNWKPDNAQLKLDRNDGKPNENDGVRVLMRARMCERFSAIHMPCGAAQ